MIHVDTPDSLVDGAIELFSLPDIYFQVSEMISDPRFTIQDIGAVISKDPALSVKLLKVVNSSLYGFQAKIDTISRAIVVVGIDDLKNLVLATSVLDQFQDIPCELVDMTAFWMRSMRCGIIAKCLAKESSVLHSERLFLAGILHDIGSLILYRKMPEESLKVLLAADHNRDLVAGLEQTLLGFNHADVSAELIRNWGLPESLYEAISCYLKPDSAAAYQLDAYILAMSVHLVNALEQGITPEQIVKTLDLGDYAPTRLNEEQISMVMHLADEEFAQIFDLIGPSKRFH